MLADDEHYDVTITHINYSDDIYVPLIVEKVCVTTGATETSGLVAMRLSKDQQQEKMIVTLPNMKHCHYTITIESENYDHKVTTDQHGLPGEFTIALANGGQVGVQLSCRCGNIFDSPTY